MKYHTRKKLKRLSDNVNEFIVNSINSIINIADRIDDKLATKTNDKKAYKEFKKVIQKELIYNKSFYLTEGGFLFGDNGEIIGTNIDGLFSSNSYLSLYEHTMLFKLKLYSKEEFTNKWIKNIKIICKEDNFNFEEISKNQFFKERDRNDNYYRRIKRIFKISE